MNRQNIHITFDNVFTYLHLFRASMKAQRNVGWKASVQNYKKKRNIVIANTLKDLRLNKYKSKGFYTFTKVERGKERLIRSNHITERVVQKCLCDYCLTPTLRTKLIYDNGATLKHKGCEFVIKRTKLFIRKAIREQKPIYFLTMDFHSYFENINHKILIDNVSKYVNDYRLINLYTHFIKCFGNKGLGLGSQVSQISAIFYTHNIDNFIKHNCHFKYYTRYMDDSIIISTNKEKLKRAIKKIKNICIDNCIELNDKKTILSKNHCSYLKRHFVVNNKLYSRPCKDSFYRMMKKLKIFFKWYKEHKITLDNIETSFQSWRSHFLKDNAKIIVNKANIIYNNLKEYYL